jgi:hypothetical protein
MSSLAIQSQPFREQLAGGRVKGSIIRAHLNWVRDHASREETIELFEALPNDVRGKVSTVLAASWYDFATLIAVDRTILSLFGNDDITFLERLGAYSAQTNLSGVYRFLQPDALRELFRRAALLYRQFQDFGTAEYAALTPGTGVMRHRGYTAYSPLFCASAIGFYRECIALHGGVDAAVRESECQCSGAPSCAFEMAWR